MSFIGTVGVVAQQGNQTVVSSAPENVSIATSSSGNYDNAIISGEANCNNETMTLDGSEFSAQSPPASGSAAQRDVEAGVWEDIYTGCDNSAIIHYQGYIRAQNATSYAWNIVGLSPNTSLSNSCVASIAGTASTTQDETGLGDNIGEYLNIAFGGGRGGVTYPVSGDVIELTIQATATNSAGSTNSDTLTITYDFVD